MIWPRFPGTDLADFQFVHPGLPIAQGSKNLVFNDRYGRPLKRPHMIDYNKSELDQWRRGVAKSAKLTGARVFEGDILMVLTFVFSRPASHWRADESLSQSKAALARPRKKDADKLARAVMDALSGVLYPDDRDVALLAIERRWSSAIGLDDHVHVKVAPAPPEGRWFFLPTDLHPARA